NSAAAASAQLAGANGADVPRSQYSVRGQRSAARTRRGRDRRDAPVGAAHGADGGDRREPAAVEGPPALPRVGPRVEHRLQPSVRGPDAGGPRAAAPGRGVPGGAGRAGDPRSDHRRGLLPAIRGSGYRGADGSDRSGAGEGVAAATRVVLRGGDRGGGRHAGADEWRVQGGDGDLLPRGVGLPSVGGDWRTPGSRSTW